MSGTGTGSLIPLPSSRPLQNLPSFPRRRQARHTRHCGLDPQSRGAVPRGGRHTGFKAVSTGWGMIQRVAVFCLSELWRICRIVTMPWHCFHPHPPPLWIADQVRNDVTDRLCWLVVHPHPPPLWIADQVRNDVTMLVHRFHPHPRPVDCGSSPQ